MDAYVQCDAPGCNARAYVATMLPNEHFLDFCGHHWTKYQAQLEPIAVAIEDHRELLNAK